MAFYTGQKVVFIGEGDFSKCKEYTTDLKHPVRGQIYTVRNLTEFAGVPGMRLVEIVNKPRQYREGFDECSFLQKEFVPLNPHETSISLFDKMLKDLNGKHRVH